MNLTRIGIIGDGGWGTAIAKILSEKGLDVAIWGHDARYLDTMRASRENTQFLPGITLPASLSFEADLPAVMERDLVVNAVPTAFLRTVYQRSGLPQTSIVSLTKGIERATHQRPTEILTELLKPKKLAVLSGPSHAEEVAHNLPATLVAASTDAAFSEYVQELFMTPTFRVYTSVDLIGVELGGALKNVIAVAAGILEGLKFGDNTRAALFTRGLAEMTRLGVAMGAHAETFAGLSGVGDLFTTCVSPFGRNRSFGLAIAEGQTLEAIQASRQTVAEGVYTCTSVHELAAQLHVEMPITEALYDVLTNGANPKDAIMALMSRAPKPEAAP